MNFKALLITCSMIGSIGVANAQATGAVLSGAPNVQTQNSNVVTNNDKYFNGCNIAQPMPPIKPFCAVSFQAKEGQRFVVDIPPTSPSDFKTENFLHTTKITYMKDQRVPGPYVGTIKLVDVNGTVVKEEKVRFDTKDYVGEVNKPKAAMGNFLKKFTSGN